MNDIESFLDLLVTSSQPVDKLFLVNLCDCCEHQLVAPADVMDFLCDCVKAVKPDHRELHRVIAEVSESMKSSPTMARYLRLSKRDCSDLPGRKLDHTVTYPTFIRFHVKENLPTGHSPPLLPMGPVTSPAEMDRLRGAIGRVTNRSGWHRPEATLGTPLPRAANCWLSVDAFPDTASAHLWDDKASPADRTRDALGLIDYTQGVHLIRYTIKGDDVAKVERTDMARPTFADLGNKRFRVSHRCQRGQEMAAAGWGATVHLARLPDNKLHPATGRPERVTRALRLQELGSLEVDYLGATNITRGAEPSDGDAAFLEVALAGRKPEHLKTRIIQYLAPYNGSAPS